MKLSPNFEETENVANNSNCPVIISGGVSSINDIRKAKEIGNRNIEGIVESIGWRLTVVRTFSKNVLYIPNAAFANIIVENATRMTNRRINEDIGLRYDDLSKMPLIVTEVRDFLSSLS